MKNRDIKEFLDRECTADAYRIIEKKTESHELFFVHEKLETVRSTDTLDTNVTVYVDHDGSRGDSSFSVFRGMDDDVLKGKLRTAEDRAKLVFNQPYELPGPGTCEKTVENTFGDCSLKDSAELIADTVFSAPCAEGCSLNALEVFVYRETVRIRNSRGVDKTQHKVRAAVEAIPTYTDGNGSVELYEMLKFTDLDPERIREEIAEKMREVHDRAKAAKPEGRISCPIVLRTKEISSLLSELAYDVNYRNVYSKANLFSVGDTVQNGDGCDKITLSAVSYVKGSDKSAAFDEDGTDLTDAVLIKDGKVESLFGSSRFGQYLNIEKPTGALPCIRLGKGTLTESELNGIEYLELVSLSGIQGDLFNDYLGGEIRLAYHHKDGKATPVTGITFSARLSESLNTLRLSDKVTTDGEYEGPDKLMIGSAEVI